MKLLVLCEDGETKTLDLTWPVSIIPASATLWRMKDANGVEHFFTDNGHYDGCGRAHDPDLLEPELMEALEDVRLGLTKPLERLILHHKETVN